MTECKICGNEYKRLRLHLRIHDIDPMDYWIKYVSETHEQPKCKYCGAPITHFINDSINMGPGVYCSKNCMDADLPNVLSNRHLNGIYDGTSYLINTWNSNPGIRLDSLARTSYHRLLRANDPFMTGYFYIVILDSKIIKFGATSQDIKYYIDYRYNRYFDCNIISIFKGTLLNVSSVEYYIKTRAEFKIYNPDGLVSSTEELPLEKLDHLMDLVNKFTFMEKI